MATNNFKPFATGTGANVTSQAEWEALAALRMGFQSGKASSAQVNKAIRQALFIASALAQYTADKSGIDVLDDGDVSGFVAKMSAAFGADFQPKDAMLTAFSNLNTVNMQFPVFNGPKSLGVGTLTNLSLLLLSKATAADMLSLLTAAPLTSPTFTGDPKAPTPSPGDNDTSIATTAFVASAIAALGSAASRNVGTSTNQIPDMTSFTSGASWFKLPNGFIVQFFTALMADTSASTKVVSFPLAFPNGAISVVATHNGPQPGIAGIFGINNLSKTTFQSYTSVTPQGNIGAFIIAVGY